MSSAVERYQQASRWLFWLAKSMYGLVISWYLAAKGPFFLWFKALLAGSYQHIYGSNLVWMGVIPFDYLPGLTADTPQWSIHNGDILNYMICKMAKSALVS